MINNRPNSNLDLQKAKDVAYKAAILGREILVNHFGHLANVSEKDQAGLVSEADLESEKVITQYLRQAYPEFAILGEEGAYQNRGESLDATTRHNGVWIIDPLDGTTNYVHQLPIYCISIGLEVAGQIVVAVCDVPVFKRTYTATRGGGAFVVENDDVANARRLRVSERTTIHQSLLATGFTSYDKVGLKSQLQVFAALIEEARGIRRVGSAVYDLCLVAEGVFDAYWERGLSPWDIAAGSLLVTEAGGVVGNFHDRPFSSFDRDIVAGSQAIHDQVKKQILKFN